VGEPLRAALLDAFTEPGWPHATAAGPPPGKWVRETNDGVGELPSGDGGTAGDGDPPNSWGLSATALAAVARSPSVRTVLARLGALYPEYAVRFMPADALEPEGVPGGMSAMFGNGNDDHRPGGDEGEETNQYDRIATVVGNAAVNTDSFKWHLDMDPQSLHPAAPFAERFGSYVNRSVARPFFVSALVYLNGPEPWTPEKDAETLVLDPGTGTGVFIRPAPGRVLLMDQDATHRVSPPSRSVDVPRYSAVFKLCFYPKDPETRPSLTREEWGAPIRFGTAGGRRAGAEMLGGGEESEEEYVS
jgi:probable phosphoglycerate mutase